MSSDETTTSNKRESTSAKYPQYQNDAERLRSYHWWPKSLNPRPEALCDAGFFYTGRSDRVICHACGGGLKDWSGEDSPWVEHAVMFQNCSYLNEMKGKQYVDQVQKLLTESKTNKIEICNQQTI